VGGRGCPDYPASRRRRRARRARRLRARPGRRRSPGHARRPGWRRWRSSLQGLACRPTSTPAPGPPPARCRSRAAPRARPGRICRSPATPSGPRPPARTTRVLPVVPDVDLGQVTSSPLTSALQLFDTRGRQSHVKAAGPSHRVHDHPAAGMSGHAPTAAR
jgi:hypothetical protein